MIKINEILRINCTGCGACQAKCPVQCITMVPDSEGFLNPSINDSECILCGKCLKICPFHNNVVKKFPIRVIGAQRLGEVVVDSSSGGIGALIAEKIILNKGIVYGCILNDKFEAVHIRIADTHKLDMIKGSKYVQSDLSQIYESLKKDCESNRLVAFFGTPCQIAGVKNYLEKEYDNFICVDLICHGVPSPNLFKKYISYLEKCKKAESINTYKFRDKSVYGWNTAYTYTYTCNGKVYSKNGYSTEDPYYEAFIYAETYRESCYVCNYATEERVGDITIGDFWGVLRFYPDLESMASQGISAVLINTCKGNQVISELWDNIFAFDSDLKKVEYRNGNLVVPATRPGIRDVIYKNIDKYGIEWLNNRMRRKKRFYINRLKNGIPVQIKAYIKRKLGRY